MTSPTTEPPDRREHDPRLAKAIHLFEFLQAAQRLRAVPVRDLDSYLQEGDVVWFSDIPAHPAVEYAGTTAVPEPDASILKLRRIHPHDPPEPPEELRCWLAGDIDIPNDPPRLRDRVPVSDVMIQAEIESVAVVDGIAWLDRNPAVRGCFDRWLHKWTAWADRELVDRPIRTLYRRLFHIRTELDLRSEELELVLAVGCLAWRPASAPPVRRHVLVSWISIDFDEVTGDLTVVQSAGQGGVSVELDMLDPKLTGDPLLNVIKDEAREYVAHPLDREEAGGLVRRLVYILDAAGRYDPGDDSPTYGAAATAAFAPAIILRRRSRQGLVEIYGTIVDQLRSAGEVPDGLLALVDPDHRPISMTDLAPGAVVTLDDEPFLPLPVNAQQLEILRSVDAKAQTVVQGPPGTGKTHTAAVLISHLLAQGKRVLVTAHTDRALKEVRAKLPTEIQALSVAVVGGSREDMSDLRVAVARISEQSTQYDEERSERQISATLTSIDRLRRARASLHRKLLDAREYETGRHSFRQYDGTLAAIAKQRALEVGRYGWLADLAEVTATASPPLMNSEALEWLDLARKEVEVPAADEQEADLRLPHLAELPSPEEFGGLCHREVATREAAERFSSARQHEAFARVRRLPSADRVQLQNRLRALAREMASLDQLHEPWVQDAIADVRSGQREPWELRAVRADELLDKAESLQAALGPLVDIRIDDTDVGRIEALTQRLVDFLNNGKKIKTSPDGRPKIGPLSPKTIKQCRVVFQGVRVDGQPPSTKNQLRAVLTHIAATRVLQALDRTWPAAMRARVQDGIGEWLAWHQGKVQQLRRVVAFSVLLSAQEMWLRSVGLSIPDWGEIGSVLEYAMLVDAATAEEDMAAASGPLRGLSDRMSAYAARCDSSSPAVRRLQLAVQERDQVEYASAYDRLQRLHQVADHVGRRSVLSERLRHVAAGLHEAVQVSPGDPAWPARLGHLEEAWDWAAAGAWVLDQERVDVNALQAEISGLDEEVRRETARLAALRAWGHAVSPGRLGGRAQTDLQQYAQLVRRLGKGTGKYAAKQRASIRTAMDRCRTAVPVWIMPIYRIAEQLQVEPSMFDVVVVDEASQAGLEATFLQYLAPRIVVIGDDKQVSPAAVGVDQQQLRDLARQYIADDRYLDTWQDPKHSFFDEAKMRYTGRITLTEHRRCVPEIIGFSNRIAYEPEGIRLLPVRQYGADRLEPIKAVYTPHGYERGTSARTNPVEVDAIVEQLEKCLTDPRYDDKTFGVISLLGSAQARAIERALLERIGPEEWSGRDVRCGDAADFQGSERDVIFLSMVASAAPGRRLGTLTREQDMQRYNVAVSRAKDQLWLVHSIKLSDVGNSEDMRHQLLDYCYRVIDRRDNGGPGLEVVPEDERVSPFDSLFEQRVFNRIIDRGYRAIPQLEVTGYRIDIVVEGAQGRLAVECDGDEWHGPEQYEHDLARQRDLERCGWRFHRVLESEFYVDSAGTMAKLWDSLERAAILPIPAVDEPSDSATERVRPRDSERSEGTTTGSNGAAGISRHASQDDDEPIDSSLPFGATDERLAVPLRLTMDRFGGTAELAVPSYPGSEGALSDDLRDAQGTGLESSAGQETAEHGPLPELPRVRDGKILLTTGARERVWHELDEIKSWLLTRQEVRAADRWANQAQRETMERKRAEYEKRRVYLQRVLLDSFAPHSHIGGRWVTPGCVLRLQFRADPHIARYVISLVQVDDDANVISPFSSLGQALDAVERGDTVSYETPGGKAEVTVVDIVD